MTKVRAEQIKLTYKQLPTLTISNLVGSLLLVIILWNKVQHHLIFIWILLLFLTVIVATLILLYSYNRSPHDGKEMQLWGMLISILGFFRSSAWASSGFFLYVPNDFIFQFILFSFTLGASGFLIAQATAYKPAFYAVSIPIFLPVCLRFIIEGDALHILIASAGIMYQGAIIYFYQKIHKTLQESLVLRFEKIDLSQELAQQKSEAEQANLAKSRFLAAASHDLRQPLHAQGLFVAELHERIKDSESRDILQNLEKSMSALNSSFSALLDISKLDAGVVQTHHKHFLISHILNDLELDFHVQAREKGLNYKVRPCETVIHSDPELLSRILRNLVSNAIRYTSSGGVLVGCRDKGNDLSIEIWDTGYGIHTDQQQTIFQEYYQIGNIERNRNKGLGLGLAIVKRLAHLLGHKIVLASTIGKGSKFSIYVPIGNPKMMGDKFAPAIDYTSSDVAGAAILVIDDEEIILKGMRTILQTWGCNVITAFSAKEASRLLQEWEHRPNIIIADYQLQNGLKGDDAIAEIKSEFNLGIPGILITGDTAPDRIRKANASGYHLLHKPVPPAKLRSLVSNLLRQQNIAMLASKA